MTQGFCIYCINTSIIYRCAAYYINNLKKSSMAIYSQSARGKKNLTCLWLASVCLASSCSKKVSFYTLTCYFFWMQLKVCRNSSDICMSLLPTTVEIIKNTKNADILPLTFPTLSFLLWIRSDADVCLTSDVCDVCLWLIYTGDTWLQHCGTKWDPSSVAKI